ncbi:DNA primase [Olsenella massiliensis]|uniref:DNA primase n=1 Tax=Olsenella massiliensis TaxID=1622075 RepID=UPI00071D4626|nr:DNA primase [Olsenella massiliensis]
MISDEDKERVRQATDPLALVGETVELKRRGRDYWGCCPFHQEKSPSFHVNPETGLWKCFGCGAGGDVFAYVMRRESLDFPDAIRYLADRAGVELTEERGAGRRGPRRNRLLACVQDARDFYALMLMRGRGEGPDAARHYLAGRGFGSSVCRDWGLGFAEGRGRLVAHLRSKGYSDQELLAADLALEGRGGLRDRFFDRVIFPISDEQGRPIGFGGRVLTDAKPKYLNTKDTTVFRKGKHLFAFDRAKDEMVRTGAAVVCEGYTDVIALHQAGFTNAVAALGTALTLDHVTAIGRFAKRRVICMFDGDEAGQRAAERTIQFLDKTPLELLCVVLPGGLDPAEFLQEQGPEALRSQLEAAVPLMAFVFEKRLARFDVTVPGQRVAALDDLSSLLAPLGDSILLDAFATQLAGLVGVDVAEAKRRIAARRAGRQHDGPTQTPAPRHDEPVQTFSGQAAGMPLRLSEGERRQLAVERELLSIMTTDIDQVRDKGERIGSLTWVDARDQAMAWAMLATPPDSTPAQVVGAAAAVVAEAPQILSEGTMPSTADIPTASQVEFLVDMMDLWTSRQRLKELKARVMAAREGDQADLMRQANQVQQHVNELAARLTQGV